MAGLWPKIPLPWLISTNFRSKNLIFFFFFWPWTAKAGWKQSSADFPPNKHGTARSKSLSRGGAPSIKSTSRFPTWKSSPSGGQKQSCHWKPSRAQTNRLSNSHWSSHRACRLSSRVPRGNVAVWWTARGAGERRKKWEHSDGIFNEESGMDKKQNDCRRQ